MSKMKRQKVNHGKLISICLIPDTYTPQCQSNNHLKNGKIIGAVHLSVEGTTCTDLRRLINMNSEFPNDFRFLNCHGWPFDPCFEDKVFVTDCQTSGIVTIQTQHKKLSRIGIKLLNGDTLGFIFLSFSYDISVIRNLIMSELNDIFENAESFEFIDNNAWPVRRQQENSLCVWDIVFNNYITIVKKPLKRHIECEESVKGSEKRFKFETSNVQNVRNDEMNSHFQKSILISYVHAEASTYARDLKNELLKLGFKDIFLDVDNIAAGQDWQDVISLAVNECSIFVPLVTTRYGETRWTSREAKLADDKEKIIIPISFLDKWPPDPLAIQFVTLQYIPWKSPDIINGDSSETNNNSWSKKCVQRVAAEIQKLCSKPDLSTVDSASIHENSVKPSEKFTLNLRMKHRPKQKKKKGDLVVISAHCKQKEFVDKVTDKLKCVGYDVWCSADMCECDESSFSPIEDSQPVIDSPVIESNGQFNSYGEMSGDDVNMDSNIIKMSKKEFKQKVKQSKVVVLVFSEDYLKSRVCKQQLFYCKERTSIVIKYGEFQIDSMILNLYPEHDMITNENLESLKFKIEDKLKFDSDDFDSYRNTIMLSVSTLKNVINTNCTVYVFGGTKNVSKEALSFSMTLGTELAKVTNLCLATEGFSGTGDLVGKNFCEEQEIRNRDMAPNVFHIIPVKDVADYSDKAKQRSDGTFEKLPYGNTLFYGNSVSNRDDIVAAAFKLCILIEGGERSACLAEKFLWNDCTVIPVLYSNSAVENKQRLTESINLVPEGVNACDWHNLRIKCSPEDRARSVRRIVCCILNL